MSSVNKMTREEAEAKMKLYKELFAVVELMDSEDICHDKRWRHDEKACDRELHCK